MRIVALTAENFKRLRAVSIRPVGSVVQITGRNGAGKSSVLDAVFAALGGSAAAPDKPVREGADGSTVFVDLGDIRITRKFSAAGKTTLVVESGDGLRYPSPQAVLDELVGRLTFDPLAFSRMDAKKQAQTLRDLVGLDTSKLDADRKRAFDERTDVNRDLKKLQAQLGEMPAVEAPDAEVSMLDVARELSVANDQVAKNERARRDAADCRGHVIACQRRVEIAESALESARKDLAAAKDDVASTEAIVAGLVDPVIGDVTERMGKVEQTNAKVRAKKARAAKAAEFAAKDAEAAALTKKLAEVDHAKTRMLAEARFPIVGLSIEGDAVTMNGFPFSQASSAQQLRCCLAIGAALNPKLRVVLVRDGSLLDEEGLGLVEEWAETNNMQVLMERVSDGRASAGILIEDGEVVESESAPVEEPAAFPVDDFALPEA